MNETKKLAIEDLKLSISKFNRALEDLKRDIDNATDVGLGVSMSYDLPDKFNVDISEKIQSCFEG